MKLFIKKVLNNLNQFIQFKYDSSIIILKNSANILEFGLYELTDPDFVSIEFGFIKLLSCLNFFWKAVILISGQIIFFQNKGLFAFHAMKYGFN